MESPLTKRNVPSVSTVLGPHPTTAPIALNIPPFRLIAAASSMRLLLIASTELIVRMPPQRMLKFGVESDRPVAPRISNVPLLMIVSPLYAAAPRKYRTPLPSLVTANGCGGVPKNPMLPLRFSGIALFELLTLIVRFDPAVVTVELITCPVLADEKALPVTSMRFTRSTPEVKVYRSSMAVKRTASASRAVSVGPVTAPRFTVPAIVGPGPKTAVSLAVGTTSPTQFSGSVHTRVV